MATVENKRIAYGKRSLLFLAMTSSWRSEIRAVKEDMSDSREEAAALASINLAALSLSQTLLSFVRRDPRQNKPSVLFPSLLWKEQIGRQKFKFAVLLPKASVGYHCIQPSVICELLKLIHKKIVRFHKVKMINS